MGQLNLEKVVVYVCPGAKLKYAIGIEVIP